MIFQYPYVNKATQAIKDLIRIHNDRIAAYEAALSQAANLDLSTRNVLKKIVAEGMSYREQLLEKISPRQRSTKTNQNILGKIYLAWNDLKVTFACNTRRAIISSCLYNEEITLHAYRAALNKNSGVNEDMLMLLDEHEAGLKKNYEVLKSYREIRYTADTSLMYLA